MRFLIIGGGSIGRRHINNLKQLGYNDIYCLKREQDDAFAQQHQVKVITTVDTLKDVTAVIVCSPTSLHAQGLRIARQLGAAVFMEKPLVGSHQELLAAKAAMEHFAGRFFIGFMLRFHPLLQKIKAIIDSNELGAVYHARFAFGSYLPNWHPYEDYKTSYASIRSLGGGVINTITHELDLIQSLFGNPEWVFCNAENFGKLDIEVEESADAIFGYRDKKTVTLHLDYLQKDYERSIRILCDNGNINWDWHNNKVVVNRFKVKEEIIQLDSFDVNKLYLDEMEAFINLIKNPDEATELSFDHAVKNAEITFSMHTSALSGRKEVIKFSA